MTQDLIHSEQEFLILLAEIVEGQIWLQGVLYESATRPAYLSVQISDNQATIPLLRPDDNLQKNTDMEETTLILSGILPDQSSKKLK